MLPPPEEGWRGYINSRLVYFRAQILLGLNSVI